MKRVIFKVYLIILASILLLIYIFPWNNFNINIPFSWKDYRLWLDLQWWIEFDYKVDFDILKKEEKEELTSEREKEIIENLKRIIDKRIEALWINDSELNDTSYSNEKHIIVQIPLKWNNSLDNSKNIEIAKKAIWNVVKVSFKELRTEEITDKDLKERKEIANWVINELKSWDNFSVIKDKYKLNFEKIVTWTLFFDWKDYLTDEEINQIRQIFSKNKNLASSELYKEFEEIFDKNLNLEKDKIKNLLEKSLKNISKEREKNTWKKENISNDEQRIYSSMAYVLENKVNKNFNDIFREYKNLKESEINEINKNWVEWYFIFKNSDNKKWEFIFIDKNPSEWINVVSSDWKILNDKYLVKAYVEINQVKKPVVTLNFNSEWWRIFFEATKRLIWKPIWIFVWWELVTSPIVNQPIPWWQAIISWDDYTVETARETAENINTWLVPAPIYLTSEKVIDSKIWNDALDKLIIAWWLWFLLIFIFLIIVYKLSWLAAFFALIIYLILVLAIIKVFWIVLTLASIAGLILSIGMAIDANILIFERIKAELKNWKNIKDSLEIWFKNSWSAIWDSNITWLLVALILFIFGINMIKWFWAMLAIWIIVSLFTAMWVSRIFVKFLSEVIKDKWLFIWFKK